MASIPGPALLFCPANRPDRYTKAAERGDGVILDLEDAVPAAERATARDRVLAHPLDPERTMVRVNPAGTPDHEDDVHAVRRAGYTRVMLAKASGPDDLAALDGLDVVVLCETARGVLAAPELAALDAVVALMWGAEDLMASLGGTSSRFSVSTSGVAAPYRPVVRHARSRILLSAGAHGKAAIDAVHLELDDHVGLRAEAEDAAASGFAATACLHPDQVSVVREAYRPDPARVRWAEQVLAAAPDGGGVHRHGRQMIDEPLLAQARAVLRRRAQVTEEP
ncbi:HpcH/HpaI aldolase/citrate lyase family protein [Ruania halotolerans]|uniref:HpcH/HpaI aldolase/citrate lyase family protein n=1 Tax=Ruania halotolerans TaxID=2897773 RepID=UPI001E331636|nr:CoA ester lyase [Ruania halotolerans]UFU05256.1 CoA ester lyase [Ruania halotolerans]